AEASGPKTWQGVSTGAWERPGRNAVADARVSETVQQGAVPGGGGGGPRGAPPRKAGRGGGGAVGVTAPHFREGCPRNQRAPASENATLTTHLDRLPASANGDVWLIVSTVLEDPQYLTQPLYLSTQFKKEPNGAKWNPTPCRTDPPAVPKAK